MATFLWHSQSAKDSAELLAKELEIDCGTVPPKDFSGTLICWGAKPADKFKWETRTLRAIFNDPRKVRTYLDRKVMFDKLAEAGINVTTCVEIADTAQYVNLCNLMGVTVESGFVTARTNGSKARRVTSQAELEAAVADGNCRAFDPKFTEGERIRLFVVGGTVVGAASKTGTGATDTFFAQASQALAGGQLEAEPEHVEVLLREAVEKGLIAPAKAFWSPYGAVTQAMRIGATAVSEALDMQFCAIDVVTDGGTVQILNVVTTPNLRDVPSVQAALVNAISTWNADNSRTAKEILQDLVNDATDDEADALLDKLRELKGEVGDQVAG